MIDNDLKIIYGVWIFVVVSSIIIFPLISAITSTFSPPSDDTFVYENAPTTSYPTAALLKVWDRSDYQQQSFLKFTVSDIPVGADITEAWLKIAGHETQETQGGNGPYDVYIAESSDFDETTATWNNKPDIGTDLDSVSITDDGSTDYYAWNVTDYVTGNGDFYFALYVKGTTDSLNRRFRSSDYDGSDPKLEVTYTVDTCTCPGAGNDWEIDMSDNCEITEDCDLTTGTLSFTGAGWCKCNASVDTTNLGDPGASGILYIQDSCIITID